MNNKIQVPECLNELAPIVLVVKVTGKLPDIQNQQDSEHRIDVRVVLLDLHDDGSVRLPAESEGRQKDSSAEFFRLIHIFNTFYQSIRVKGNAVNTTFNKKS